MPDDLNRLRALVSRHADDRVVQTAIPGVRVSCARGPTIPLSGIFEPAVCFVVQGAKRVAIGDAVLRYDAASYFIVSLEVAATGFISEASDATPYLAVSLEIDRKALADLLIQLPERQQGPTVGFGVGTTTPELFGSLCRLLDLLDRPQDIPVLAPMLHREVLYRLLQGEQGDMLRQIARADSRLSQVRRALGWIRAHFDEPLRIEQLAALAGMSKASLHRHFKAAAAMSPLQYQKRLRLQEARRLLAANLDAQEAAYRVGYESVSQFSREYARLFGQPPGRDAGRMRGRAMPEPQAVNA